MGALSRFLRKRQQKDYELYDRPSKMYKTVSNISIAGVFIACTILVFAFAGYFKLTPFVFGLVGTIFIICFACLFILPWVRIYEKYEFKKTSLIFMISLMVCAVLWAICLYMGIDVFNKIAADSDKALSATISTVNIIKFTLIATVQILIASFVGQTIVKYRKTLVPFQIITYISYLFVDFYITFLLVCVQLNTEGLSINEHISILGNRLILTLFALSLVFMAISSVVIKRMEARRIQEHVADTYIEATAEEKVEEKINESKTAEDKLEEIKNLLNKNLITQEEYDKKREEILKDL